MGREDNSVGSEAFYVDVGDLMASFSRIYYRWMWARLKPQRSAPGWQAILSILQEGGPKIMSAVSVDMNEAPRVITDAIDALEEANLVRRIPHPTDRRAKLIEITASGEQFLLASRHATGVAIEDLLGQFSRAERVELYKLLSRLLAAVKVQVAEDSVPSAVELAESMSGRRHRREHYVEVIRQL